MCLREKVVKQLRKPLPAFLIDLCRCFFFPLQKDGEIRRAEPGLESELTVQTAPKTQAATPQGFYTSTCHPTSRVIDTFHIQEGTHALVHKCLSGLSGLDSLQLCGIWQKGVKEHMRTSSGLLL